MSDIDYPHGFVRMRIPPQTTLNIAHRGARAFAPENTLPAFEKAKALGADMVELDVHMSKDSEIVVTHDDTLLRCTDVATKFPRGTSYFVSDFTLSELKQLDAGSWYAAQLDLLPHKRQAFLRSLSDEEIAQHISAADLQLYRSGTVCLPTLREVLTLTKSLDLLVNIEFKTLPRQYEYLVDAVVQLVKEFGLEDRTLLSSFDHPRLVEVRRLSLKIATAVLTSDCLADPVAYLKSLDADAYNPSCVNEIDSIGFHSISGNIQVEAISAVRHAGYGVNVWTCNDQAEIKALRKAGVSGIFTDYPNRFVMTGALAPHNPQS